MMETLEDIRNALSELELGIVSPILRSKTICNRRPDSRYLLSIKTVAAAAYDALLKIGIDKNQAARQVAKILGDDKLLSKGPPTARAIGHWRQTLRNTSLFKEKLLALNYEDSADGILNYFLVSLGHEMPLPSVAPTASSSKR